MIRVAVIILNWNGAKVLKQFLPSVVKYTDLSSASIIVADNGSTDDSKLIVSEYDSVEWLDLKDNHGFAGGYNLAIQQVEAEYIVLLNSDVEVSEGWLKPQIEYLDAHPTVAACQPKIRSWREKDKFEYAGACGGFMDKLGYPFCRGRIMSCLERDSGQYDSIIPIFWASGASLFIRRETYLKVGGLDTRFFAHMEEIDLCWRLWARGYQVVVIPEAVVYHVGGATLDYQNPQKTYLNFRNNLLMIYKNTRSNRLKQIEQKRLILDYIAILFYLLKGDLKGAKAILNARSDYKSMKHHFVTDRKNNLKLTVQEPLGVVDKSIIYQFYFKFKRHFSALFNR